MSTEKQLLLLRSFFSAYFHEDWICDDDGTKSVVTRYARNAAPADIRALGEAILDYSGGFESDRELEEELFKDLGCYYRPSGEGLSAKAWLEGVADQLLRSSRT